MPLSAGLYKSQDQQEQDLQNGPGWTIDQQKPTFFSDFGVQPALHGVGQGAAEGISVLAKGLQFPGSQSDMEAVMSGPAAGARATRALVTGQREEEPPWHQDWNAGAAELQATTRAFSKTLTADPRTTGAAANLVQGFSKAVTEFVAGSAAGGPLGGAALLGNADAYAHYQDLLDAGVDEATAKKSAILTGATSAAGAVLPMALPAKLLAGLPAVGALLTQVGAGAAINTSFGAASRYASAKILDDAGYHEMAEQQKPWDETNLLTDAITGMFFGAHAGWHGIKGLGVAKVDPSIRDAAKVVQDRQEVNERAPGVPVDMVSAAVHRQALETALGDLMMDKPVDLSEIKTEGATFARPEVDETHTADIIREEFAKSGVLDDAAAFDRWLAGEKEPEPTPKEVRIEPAEKPEAAAAPPPEGEATQPGEARPAQAPQVSPGALADRPDLQIVNENGEAMHAGDEQQKAIEAEAQANKEAEPMFQAAIACEARHA